MTKGNKEEMNSYLLMPVFPVQIKLKVGGQIERQFSRVIIQYALEFLTYVT